MTKRQHVELVRQRAADYIAYIGGELTDEAARKAIRRWESIPMTMGAILLTELCDAWLGSDDQQTGRAHAE